jgi:hypothetical protein
MTPSNDKPAIRKEKKKETGPAQARVPFFPDRSLGLLQNSPNPLFQTADLVWVVCKKKSR